MKVAVVQGVLALKMVREGLLKRSGSTHPVHEKRWPPVFTTLLLALSCALFWGAIAWAVSR